MVISDSEKSQQLHEIFRVVGGSELQALFEQINCRSMDVADELQQLHNSGIRFALQQHYGRFVVRLGDYRERPQADAILPTMEDAVGWLREQAKARYPESAYAKRLLRN
jgi:hypothetical protein